MKIGQYLIAYEELENLLGIPADHRIVTVTSPPNRAFMLAVTIEGPDMPEMCSRWHETPIFMGFPESWRKPSWRKPKGDKR